MADAGTYAVKGDWQGLMKHNEKAMAGKAKPVAAAAAAASAAAAPPDDLTQINGIGPRISSILNDGGITTFAELQHANTGDLRQIIAVGGALPPSSLDSWPTQATYAARGGLVRPGELQPPLKRQAGHRPGQPARAGIRL
jgi:predicted flap endonuclease-1-like 5' DNA nuclease